MLVLVKLWCLCETEVTDAVMDEGEVIERPSGGRAGRGLSFVRDGVGLVVSAEAVGGGPCPGEVRGEDEARARAEVAGRVTRGKTPSARARWWVVPGVVLAQAGKVTSG